MIIRTTNVAISHSSNGINQTCATVACVIEISLKSPYTKFSYVKVYLNLYSDKLLLRDN